MKMRDDNQRETVNGAIQDALEVFLRRWGDTSWRQLVDQVQPTDDVEIQRLIAAVAGIEHDADFMQTKLAHCGLLRWPGIRAYNAVWLTEEVDHGRAFDALAAALYPDVALRPADHTMAGRDWRALAAVPALRGARLYPMGALAGYLVRGAMVEHVAIGVYGALARSLRRSGESAGAEIVRRVLVQEGRHLRFFTHTARAVLGTSAALGRAVRISTELTWRPPGVDLLWANTLVGALPSRARRSRVPH